VIGPRAEPTTNNPRLRGGHHAMVSARWSGRSRPSSRRRGAAGTSGAGVVDGRLSTLSGSSGAGRQDVSVQPASFIVEKKLSARRFSNSSPDSGLNGPPAARLRIRRGFLQPRTPAYQGRQSHSGTVRIRARCRPGTQISSRSAHMAASTSGPSATSTCCRGVEKGVRCVPSTRIMSTRFQRNR
jgi:hypothetical protein